MRFRSISLSILFSLMIFLIISGLTLGDELVLKNGDRLTGSLVKMTGEKAIFTTSHSGELVVSRDEVKSFKSSRPLIFKFNDGTVIEGAALPIEDGRIGIRSSKTADLTSHDLDNIIGVVLPGAKDDTYLKGRLNASGYISEGNTDAEAYHFESEMIGRAEKHRLTVGGSYDAAEDQVGKIGENMEGYIKYDYFIRKKWYLYFNGKAVKDRFKDLNLRTFVGLGVGHQIWESAERNLSLEAGLGYTDEDYDLAPDSGYPSGRLAANYDRQLFGNEARFFHKHELLIGLEDMEDLYLKAKTGVAVPLYRNLNASIQADIGWDNTPAEGTERTDTIYRAGIDYSW